jgi:hypothetical protein
MAAFRLSTCRSNFAYFFEWQFVVLPLILVTFAWRMLLRRRVYPPQLQISDHLLVFSKFLVCPIMAFLIWQQDDRLSAILALLWPIVVLAIERSMNLIQKAVFRFKGRTLRDELENVERRFLQAIGYPAQKPGGNRQSIR